MTDLDKLKKDSIISDNGFCCEVNNLKAAIILSFEKHTLFDNIIYHKGKGVIEFVS
jgi:hypothetical protein